MNLSGKSVTAALRYWKIEPEQMLVAHDELDLTPASRGSSSTAATAARTACATSCQLLGHGKFHRLRIGIGHPGHKDRVTSWVLGRPGSDDEAQILRAIDDAQRRAAAGGQRRLQRGDEAAAYAAGLSSTRHS